MIQKQSTNTLIPRAQRYKQIISNNLIPDSSQFCIIIPCLARSFGFITNSYLNYQSKLDGVLTRQQFQTFIRKSNRIIDQELTNKSKQQKQPFFRIIQLLLKLSIVLGILSFIVLSLIVYIDEIQKEISETILTLSIVLILFSVLIGSLCPIFLYLSEYKEDNHQEIIKEKLTEFAQQTNQELRSNGRHFVEWRYEPQLFWIQLRIDRNHNRNLAFSHKNQQIQSGPCSPQLDDK